MPASRNRSPRLPLMRSRPSPAMAVALGGLFIALGGTAIANQAGSEDPRAVEPAGAQAVAAAKKLKNNSVSSGTIKNGQVKTADLANNAVTSPKIADGQVTSADLAAGAVTSDKVADNSLTAADIDISSLGGGPPTGPAGGDLSGTYPNPAIAAGAVDTTQLADGAVNTSKLAEHAVNGDKVAHETLTGVNIDESTLIVPPSGPAGAGGGALTGTYPDPSLKDGVVDTPKIADGSVTDVKVNAGNKDGLAGIPSMRTLGTGAQQAMPGNALPGGPPTGAAGGALAGSYPNPTLNVTGGPCANGKALTNVSSGAALTCSPGVYADGLLNVAAVPTAFPALTTGDSNSALGDGALLNITGGDDNSAFGLDALRANTTGNSNSAFGQTALRFNSTGSSNSGVGLAALQQNTSGVNNTAVGTEALFSNNGDGNTAVGVGALDSNTTGSTNSALGTGALQANSIGTANSAVGDAALGQNTDGTDNAAVGATAMRSNVSGDGNAVLGNGALYNASTGNRNSALGQNALINNSGGSDNVAIGFYAGQFVSTGNNNIDIANSGASGESGTTRIGTNGTQTSAFIAGIRGTTTGVADAIPVLIDSEGQLGTTSSSRRYKTDIEPLGEASDPLMKLRPVSFRYRSNPSSLEYGLIAEQVAKVMPTLAVLNERGLPETVQYQELPVLLLNEVQQQRRENRSLRTRIDRQQAQIDWLIRKVSRP